MKKGNRLLGFFLAMALLGTMAGHARPAEQKVALVIGNSAYPSARLKNPVNDATAMAAKLRSLGFNVILKTDANFREMTRAVSQFGQKLTPGSVSLFYYAGHGMQVRGKNFLIPTDAEIENESSVFSEAVDVDQLLNQLGPARLSMVILDACRNNPFERRFRSAAGGGLAQIDAPTGTMLAYATAPGKVASDGTGNNGLYTEALLKALDMPGLKVEDIFKQVRIHVVKASDGQQTPWESSSLTGEYYFRPDNKAALQEERLKQAEKERQDLLKIMEEERKNREQDAVALKQEMEKLRAELLKLKEAPGTASATQVAAVAKPAPSAPAPDPQSAVKSPAPKPVQAPPAVPLAAKTAAAEPAPPPPELKPAVVAMAAPSTTAPAAGEWAQRIALLERSRGQLSWAKAMAILLDISEPDQLNQLLIFEGQLNRMPWQSAYAVGPSRVGNISWGTGFRWPRAEHASEKALERCGSAAPSGCKVVMQNGEFNVQAFIDVATQLGKKDIASVRAGFLRSLANWQGKF